MKKTAAAAISAVMMITAFTAHASAENTDFETAKQAVSNIGAGWNLGNALDSTGDWIAQWSDGKPERYETAWGNPVTTKELMTAVKNAGFNAVRVPVTWSDHIDDNGSIDKEWLDRVQEVVDYVISQDMYCVLNVHHDAGADGWLEASEACYKSSSKKFEGLWKNIAERFRNYGEKLIFESFNEMLDKNNSWSDAGTSDAYKAVNDFNALFVKTVRSTGGSNAQRNLMLQVYSASCTPKTLAGFELPKDTVSSHLIIQVHNYDPQGFTATDATWTTMTDTWGSTAEKQYLDKLFSRLGEFSEKQGAPVVVGEYGANYKENESSRKTYADYFVTAAAKQGIKCFWWDTGGMALFDRSNAKVTYPDIVKAVTAPFASVQKDTAKTAASVKPAAPVVTAKVSGNKATLRWSSIEGAYCYRLYRYNASTKKYVLLKNIAGTSVTIKNIKSGTCKYIVCAVSGTDSGYKNGAYSKAVKVKIT